MTIKLPLLGRTCVGLHEGAPDSTYKGELLGAEQSGREFNMNEVLISIFWIYLSLAAFALAVFIRRTLFSKESEMNYVGRGYVTFPFTSAKAMVWCVFILSGWLAIWFMGIFELLRWLPSSSLTSELRGEIALVAAFISIYILEYLQLAPFMRQELDVRTQELIWIESKLRSGGFITDEELEKLAQRAQDLNVPHTTHLVACRVRDIAKLLKEYDEKLEIRINEQLSRS